MDNKIILTALIIAFFTCVFAARTTANAKGLSFFCSKEPNIVVILKNDANIEKAKAEILKIPKVKIIKITNRDEEWSKMVNKMDLPQMDNPFKNEVVIKINKKANETEIYKKIKAMNFVENIKLF